MFKVIIDKKFLQLDDDISTGLISGMKKLSQRDFSIFINGSDTEDAGCLSKVFQLEGFRLGLPGDDKYEKIFSITVGRTNGKNSVSVLKKSKIDTFEKAVNQILTSLRTSIQHRQTKETDVKVELSLDGIGKSSINTGIGFFDHMLEQIAKHGNISLKVKVKGDLNVDEHHTVEDVGITLGTAINEALGNKRGIKRYGFYLPMDDSIAECAVDLGGRAFLNFNCRFEREMVGEFPTELTEEFFRGLASGLKANIFIKAKGKNDHHKIEAIFKAFAKSLNEACRLDERSEGMLPSTKGVLW